MAASTVRRSPCCCRRWRHALGRSAPLHVVGLSATLEAPRASSSPLTGIADVRVIRPASRTSRTAAPSTHSSCVATRFPVRRCCPRRSRRRSCLLGLLEARDLRDRTRARAGVAVFAFTDNLDVTNRSLLGPCEMPSREARRNGPLALRAPNRPPRRRRATREGQIVAAAPLLGRPLDAASRLKVTRTSSQDAGVDLTADVIVATSSLEVGFDDPEVGARRAAQGARDDAAFLQRKGRAGRLTDMRPWTIVVLSDYGRDRLRYQAYETLFAPTSGAAHAAGRQPPRDQDAGRLVLLDWLAPRVPICPPDPTSPAGMRPGRAPGGMAVAATLGAVLEDPRRERELERRVRRALGLTEARIRCGDVGGTARSMTSAIPTLLRRLETRWSTAERWRRPVRDAPLPEHAPRALFSNLNLPEVRSSRTAATRNRALRTPIGAAGRLRVRAGEASRRFGVRIGGVALGPVGRRGRGWEPGARTSRHG